MRQHRCYRIPVDIRRVLESETHGKVYEYLLSIYGDMFSRKSDMDFIEKLALILPLFA